MPSPSSSCNFPVLRVVHVSIPWSWPRSDEGRRPGAGDYVTRGVVEMTKETANDRFKKSNRRYGGRLVLYFRERPGAGQESFTRVRPRATGLRGPPGRGRLPVFAGSEPRKYRPGLDSASDHFPRPVTRHMGTGRADAESQSQPSHRPTEPLVIF